MIRELTDKELDAVCGGSFNPQAIAFVSQSQRAKIVQVNAFTWDSSNTASITQSQNVSNNH
jgi:hypothetical protein